MAAGGGGFLADLGGTARYDTLHPPFPVAAGFRNPAGLNRRSAVSMSHHADIAVYGRDGRLQLLVEVKGRTGVSPDWAAEVRRNMYAHGALPPTPYFLMALPDRFYLWGSDGGDEDSDCRPPDYQIDPASLLARYPRSAGPGAGQVSEWGLEIILRFWLDSLMGDPGEGAVPADYKWLRESGLYDAIRGGRLVVEEEVEFV